MNSKSLVAAVSLFLAASATVGGENYFVDGYHGGIYGHYPVEWKTRFMVDNLLRNPDWRICLEIEPETWDSVCARTPEAYRDFAEILKSGRVEFTNPTYAQPYCYNIGGESIIRQFQYGMAKIGEHFPEVTYSTYSVEEPCFTSCLPGILSQLGFRYASLKCPNTCWGGYMAAYGGGFVNWIGPDGTSLLTVPRYGCEQLEDNSVWQTTAWGNHGKYWDACREAGMRNPVGMCFQDAGWKGGPWIGRHPKKAGYTLWTEYFERFAPDSCTTDYRMSQDDVRVNLMWGSQVLQRIARQVRSAENSMLMAEKIGAIARMAGGTEGISQSAVDEAWRQLMLAQHHDSWIVPYNGLWHFGTWADAIALWTGNAVGTADAEMSRMAEGISGGNYAMIKVFNTHGHAREEVVEVALPQGWPAGKGVELIDSRGKTVKTYAVERHGGNKDDKVNRLCFKATVPSFGYATYKMRVADGADLAVACDSPGGASAREIVLENDMVRLVVDLGKGGTVNSLILKQSGDEFAPSDKSGFALGEIRGFFYDKGRYLSSKDAPAEVKELVSTPLMQRLTIEGLIGEHPFTQTITLRHGERRVDYALHIDWQGNPGIGEYREKHWRDDRRGFCDDRYKLCVLFPTSFPTSKLTKDAPFDVCESTNENTFFNRWSEIKHNVILNWADATGGAGTAGLGIITDHTTSYVHGQDYPLGLTLQYSGQGLWGPNYRIDRPTDVCFAVVPHHAGEDNVAVMEDAADRFNEPLQAFVCGGDNTPVSRSMMEIGTPGYRLSAAMDSGDGVSVRLYNSHAGSSPARLKVSVPVESVCQTDLRGHVTGSERMTRRKGTSSAEIAMPGHGFRTLEIR